MMTTMKRPRRLAPILTAVLQGCALVWQASAGAQPAVRPGLSLEVRAEKSQYALGEPVYLRIRLRNPTAEQIDPKAHLEPEYGETVIVVTGPDGVRRPFTPLSLIETTEPAPPLAPNGEAAVVAPVFFGGEGWTFQQPGAYTLQAYFNAGRDEEIASNSTRIQVTADPAGARLVSNDPASLEAGKFLVWQSGDHLTQGRGLLANIARANPSSPVAQHAYLAEARNLSDSFSNYAAGVVRIANPWETLELLDRVEERTLTPHLLVQKQLDEALSLMQVDQWDSAAVRLARIQSQLDRNTYLRAYLQPLQQLDRVMLSNPEGRVARRNVWTQQREQ